MNFLVFFLLIFFILYIFFIYKNKGFFVYSKYGLPYIFLFLSLFICIISIFLNQISLNKNLKSSRSNIVFVLDVSSSMLAKDYGDKSRLEISKEFIKNYVLNNISSKYSLTIFSGESTSLLPLTDDKNLILTFLETSDEKSIIKGGTNLLESLNISKLRFNDNPEGGAIIVLSDFETNLKTTKKTELTKKINEIQKELNKKNIKLIFVGVGDEKGNYIQNGLDIFGQPIYKRDKLNNTIITKFDKEFFNEFQFDKYKISNIYDIKNIDIKNIPSYDSEFQVNIKTDYSRYFMFFSYLFFTNFLILFYYLEKKGK